MYVNKIVQYTFKNGPIANENLNIFTWFLQSLQKHL